MKSQRNLSGVHGWLRWLIFVLMILAPLLSLGRTTQLLTETPKQYPALASNPHWGTFRTITWTVTWIGVVLSFGAGYRLKTDHAPEAVSFAKTMFWIMGPGLSVVGAVQPTLILGTPLTDAALVRLIGIVAQQTIVAGTWVLYLSCSKRVRNTYHLGSSSVAHNRNVTATPASTG
jgi:hypothetical protein